MASKEENEQRIVAKKDQIDKDTQDVAKLSQVSSELQKTRDALDVLKSKLGDTTTYERQKKDTENQIRALYTLAEKTRNEIKKGLSETMARLDGLSQAVKDAPVTKRRIAEARKIITDLQGNLTLYSDQVGNLKNASKFIFEKSVIIDKQYAKINAYEMEFKNTPDVVKNHDQIKPLFQKYLDTIAEFKTKLGDDSLDFTTLKNQSEVLAPLVDRIGLLSFREYVLKQKIDQAKNALAGIDPKDFTIKELGNVLGLKNADRNDVANALAPMMLEGDGLTIEQIIAFYRAQKNEKVKTTTEADIEKWAQEIRTMDTSGKIKGTNIEGKMPEGMQDAIKAELLGPNTLKMMKVASDRYNKELNDYLNGVKNDELLPELGLTDHDWLSPNDDAAQELNLSNQEKKLVFLESYTSVLAEVIKIASDPKNAKTGFTKFLQWAGSLLGAKDWGLTEWGIGLGIAALVTLIVTLVAKDVAIKTIIGTGKLGGKGLLAGGKLAGKGAWNGGKYMLSKISKPLLMVESNYDSMINETTGQLNADARNYVLGNIKLIQARMHLARGETLEFEGDTYGPLSKKEGESRIKAIKDAVGSATLTNPGPDTPNTISKGMRDTRFKITQANKTNKQASQDSTMNKALIRFIQNMSRTEQGLSSLVLKPNSRYLNQNGAGIVGAGFLRTGEAIVPAVLGYAVSPLAGAGGLLALPSIRRTVVGGAIRSIPTKLSGFWIDKKGGRRSHTFQGVNDEHEMVRRVGQALLENSDIKKHTEYLTVKGVGGEFLILKGNTDVFNTPSEIKLLDDLERAVKDAGGIEESTWKFTIARLGFICRGKGAVNGDESVGFPGVAPVVPGADPLEALKAAALQYNTLTATEKKELNALYEQIFTGKKADGTVATLTPEQIIKCGDLTRSRVVLPGTVGEKGILDGVGRDAMNNLEKSYYEDNTYADATTFDVAYSKWFSDHAKQCSNTYDAKKHLKLLNTQKKLLDFMDDKGAYAQELKDGKKSKVDADILTKIKTFREPDAEMVDETVFTSTFRVQYAKKLAKLQEIAKSTSGEIARQIASIDTINNELNTGTIKNRRDYETKMRVALNAISVDEVLFDYVNKRSGISPAPTFTSRVDAIDGFCADRVAKYISKMNAFRDSITTATDWKTKLDALAKYRKYEDSDQTALDGVDSVALVHQAYSDIYVAINALTEPVQIEEAYKKLKEINPESNVSAERVPYSKHLTYISDLEQKVTTLRGAAKREISKLFSPGNYPDVVGADGMINKLSDDLDAIRAKYGPRLCTSTAGVDELGEAEAKFVKIQAGHRAAVALSTRIAGGEFRRDADIASAIGNFQSAPAYAEYLTSFQGNFDILVSQAKIDAQNARGVNRSGAPAEPATPPPPPENPPSSPEPPTDSTPATPEIPLSASDFAQLKVDMSFDPLSRGGTGKMSIQQRFEKCSEQQQKDIVEDYVDALRKIAQNTSTKIEVRERAITALRRPSIKKALPAGEARSSLETFIESEGKKITKWNETVSERQKEAKSLLTGIEESLAGKTTPDEKVEALLGDESPLTPPQKELVRSYRGEDGSMTEENFSAAIQHLLYKTQEVGVTGATIVDLHNALVASGSMVEINVSLGKVGAAVIGENVNETVNVRGGGKR